MSGLNLDFGDLLDFCELDNQIREAFRLMAKDIERIIRVRFINDIVNESA